ncbi:MAG: hypothetical protein ABJK11_01290, partial [Balneola sp.]
MQTNGGNPGDFTVTDVRGSTFTVSAQSDGVSGDYYISLTTADLSAAIWPLTVTYTNNNGEISDLSGAQVLSTSGVSISNASASFDVSEAAYTQLFSTTSQVNDPRGIAFNPSGSKMFIAGTHGTSRVVEYSLSLNFDVSTASYVNYIDVSSGGMGINEGIAFNDDGTKLFVLESDYDERVKVYSLGTGFDVSTASHVRNFRVTSQESAPTGIALNPSGSKMFVVGTNDDAVVEYSLSTDFDVSTASYVREFSVAGQETSPTGVVF